MLQQPARHMPHKPPPVLHAQALGEVAQMVRVGAKGGGRHIADGPGIPHCMNPRLAAALVTVLTWLAPRRAQAADPLLEPGQHFTIDPVADVVLTASSAGAAALTDLILSTGEIVPNPPPLVPGTMKPDSSKLLPFDRIAVTQSIDPNASLYSNVGLGAAVAFAGVDSVLSGLRDGWDAALVDAVIYAESMSITLFVTDVTKIAVRRPRPLVYSGQVGAETDRVLSFFSGHASTTAAVAATATYLAFVRSPNSPRPWITLGAGALLTAFVSYERVRSGNHFPTDVLAGSMAGAAIGVLVPHLHHHPKESPNLWIGAAPISGGGGVAVSGSF
jgi:undecaprenyl-diphosphatase